MEYLGSITNENDIVTKGYVDNAAAGKQNTLVSGTNIKTINNQSILGSGNIDIAGGGGTVTDVQTFSEWNGEHWESVVENGVAKLPFAQDGQYGVVQLVDDTYGGVRIISYDSDGLYFEYDVPAVDGYNEIFYGVLPEATTTTKGAMSAADKVKLNGIASGAEVNVQSDWNQSDNTADDFIKNKPTIPDAVSVTQITSSGTNIADITIGNATTHLYAPSGGGGGTVTDVQVDGTSVVSGGVAEIDLAGKADVADIPTKVSDLTNDSGFITSYTETDPVFTASAAHGITSSDISNWNGKSDFSGSYNDLTNKPTIPAAVSVTRKISTGTNIADITIGNTTTQLYAPSGVGRNFLRHTLDFDNAQYSPNVTFAKDIEGVTVATFAAYTDEVAYKGITLYPCFPFRLVRNKLITLSFWYRSDSWGSTSGGHNYVLPSFEIRTSPTSGTRTKYHTIYDSSIVPTTTWKRFVGVYDMSDSFFNTGSGTIDDNSYLTLQFFQHNQHQVQVKQFQLEIGDYVTDWKAAPEDERYQVGDKLNMTISTASYLTTAGKEITVTLPLGKYINANGFTASSLTAVTRQNGQYTHGSAATTYATWTQVNAPIYGGTLHLTMTNSTTTNSVNNAPIGINLRITGTFT